jgi:hypothetical protein
MINDFYKLSKEYAYVLLHTLLIFIFLFLLLGQYQRDIY